MVWGSLFKENCLIWPVFPEGNIYVVVSGNTLRFGDDVSEQKNLISPASVRKNSITAQPGRRHFRHIQPHIFEDLDELCLECGIQVPQVQAPKVTWISILDRVSKITADTFVHPWVFFEQGRYDAASACFSRTTSPNPNAKPPRRVGTPSHIGTDCRASCHLITRDAWVDFEKCKPLPAFAITLEGRPADSAIVHFRDQRGAKVCTNESKNIEAQLWVALLAHRGVYGSYR